jgi:hypothetical protein
MVSDPTHAQDQAAQDHAASSSGAMKHAHVKERVAHEVRLFFFIFLYLFIMIGLFTIYERIVLAQHQIRYAHYGFALVNALVLAKVMLIAEDLHLGRRFENRPLIYPVLVKSVLFAVVFICFHVVEDVLMGLWDGKSFRASIPGLGGGGIAGYLSIGLIMSFALIPFFAFTEVSRVLGPGVLQALLLKHRPADVAVELKLRARGGE